MDRALEEQTVRRDIRVLNSVALQVVTLDLDLGHGRPRGGVALAEKSPKRLGRNNVRSYIAQSSSVCSACHQRRPAGTTRWRTAANLGLPLGLLGSGSDMCASTSEGYACVLQGPRKDR